MTSIEADHMQLVESLFKRGDEVELHVTKARLARLLAAVNIATWASSMLDLAKKEFFYNKEVPELAGNEVLQQNARILEASVMPFLDAAQIEKLHAAVGIAGEGMEVLEGVRNELLTGKSEEVNVVEELGDSEFYMEALRRLYGVDRDDVLQANIDKLEKRYGGRQYSDAAAVARADKQDDNVPAPVPEPKSLLQPATKAPTGKVRRKPGTKPQGFA